MIRLYAADIRQLDGGSEAHYARISLERRQRINAMKSAFYSFDERLALIDEVIKPRYAVLIG